VTLGPGVVWALAVGALWARAEAARRRNESNPSYTKEDWKRDCFSLLLIISFVVYAPASKVAIETFACETVETGTFLSADLSVDCTSTTHRWNMAYAAVMLLLYPFGVPALYQWQLMTHRDRINPPSHNFLDKGEKRLLRARILQQEKMAERNEDPSIRYLAFLFDSYLPKFWWAEVAEAIRRLSLSSAPILLMRSTTTQIIILLLLSFLFNGAYASLRPFAQLSDSTLATTAQWAVTLTLIGAAYVRTSDGSDGDDAGALVTGVLLLIINATVVVLGVVLAFWNGDGEAEELAMRWFGARDAIASTL